MKLDELQHIAAYKSKTHKIVANKVPCLLVRLPQEAWLQRGGGVELLIA
jgi:hypothetical protein